MYSTGSEARALRTLERNVEIGDEIALWIIALVGVQRPIETHRRVSRRLRHYQLRAATQARSARIRLLILTALLVALGKNAKTQSIELDEAFSVGLIVTARFVEADELLRIERVRA